MSARTLLPRTRPPVAVRLLVGLLGLATAVGSMAILIADRAPGALKTLFGDAAVRVSNRLDAGPRAGAALGDRVPETDQVVHIAIWATVTVLFGLALWTWWGLAATAFVTVVASSATELAQGRWSTTREVERTDAIANIAGVTSGVVACALCYLLWSGAASVRRRARRDEPAIT